MINKKTSNKKLLSVLKGNLVSSSPPIWLMRQAGRYLPEYRKIRKNVNSFLDLCYTPDLATEITLQPIQRFKFDGAILFSDILVIPHALGQNVTFEENKGPVLEPIKSIEDIKKLNLSALDETLNPIYQTAKNLHHALDDSTTLLGFCGAPWTVATYMIEGGTSKNHSLVKKWIYKDPDSFQLLIDLLIDASAEYLIKQLDYGVDAVQIFDSWAHILTESQFQRWCIDPTKKIIDKVRAQHANAPIIAFPKGIGVLYKNYIDQINVNALSIDHYLPLEWAHSNLQSKICIQGNLDPNALVNGGKVLQSETKRILDLMSKKLFIFNLGHGILPDTPLQNVYNLIDQIKSY